MFPYLDGALRRDLPPVAAAVLADLEKARITEGMHVLAAGDRAKKGVVEEDDGSSDPYKVRWSDGELSDWLYPADIVLGKRFSREISDIFHWAQVSPLCL